MKNIKFLIAIFTAAVLMAGCATTQNLDSDEGEENAVRRVGDRVYVDDPYYGTVVLERDPVTGRYRDVTYGSGFGYRGYGYGYPNNYRNYRGGYRNYGGYNRSYGNASPAPQQSPAARDEARKKILGN